MLHYSNFIPQTFTLPPGLIDWILVAADFNPLYRYFAKVFAIQAFAIIYENEISPKILNLQNNPVHSTT
jgi:hypothetical protein